MPQWEWAGGGICFNPHFYATETFLYQKVEMFSQHLNYFTFFTFKYIFAMYLLFSSYYLLFIDSFAL